MADVAAQDLALGAEFPKATREDWLKLVESALKGASFEKKLVSRTYDGLPIQPLYERRDGAPVVAARAAAAPWLVMQRVDHPDAAAANAEALVDLENGATGLTLVFAGSVGAYGFGLDASEATIARVLDSVYLDAGIAIELDLSPQSNDAAMIIARLVKQRGIAAASTRIRFGFDPLGAMAVHGSSPLAWRDIAANIPRLVSDLTEAGFAGPLLAADGRVVHAAGGSEAQELAFTLAVAVAYLRALEAGGIALDDARRMIFFRLAADADQFLTIAKFRALRKLWARVEEACGLAPRPAFIAAETAWRMMTKRDPWVNMLRTTIATFSAGLGGADTVTVLPFTAALGLPDRFARRIARNTQLILLEESNLAKVTDPAAGSGGFEALTDELCARAWSRFQEIEKAGGAAAALEAGHIQREVESVRREREAALARRKDALTGASEFPNINETPVTVLDVKRATQGPSRSVAVTCPPLRPFRLAEPYEALRDASDRVLASTGTRPSIFLANLGPISAFTARAMYAKNFFEAGGIAAISNDGFASHDEMIAAFKASGTTLVCLCSSDDIYASEAIDAAKALAAAGAKHLYLAGRPGELEPALKQVGVQSFIYVGCDVLATLKAAHGNLEH